MRIPWCVVPLDVQNLRALLELVQLEVIHRDLYIDYVLILEDYVNSIKSCAPIPLCSAI